MQSWVRHPTHDPYSSPRDVQESSCSHCRTTSVGCRVSGVGCRVSGVGCRVSGVGCRVSSVECRVSSVECRVSSVECFPFNNSYDVRCNGSVASRRSTPRAIPRFVHSLKAYRVRPVRVTKAQVDEMSRMITRLGVPLALVLQLWSCDGAPIDGDGPGTEWFPLIVSFLLLGVSVTFGIWVLIREFVFRNGPPLDEAQPLQLEIFCHSC
jgi:hypothetical protein